MKTFMTYGVILIAVLITFSLFASAFFYGDSNNELNSLTTKITILENNQETLGVEVNEVNGKLNSVTTEFLASYEKTADCVVVTTTENANEYDKVLKCRTLDTQE